MAKNSKNGQKGSKGIWSRALISGIGRCTKYRPDRLKPLKTLKTPKKGSFWPKSNGGYPCPDSPKSGISVFKCFVKNGMFRKIFYPESTMFFGFFSDRKTTQRASKSVVFSVLDPLFHGPAQDDQKWPKWPKRVKKHMEAGIDFGFWPIRPKPLGPPKTAQNRVKKWTPK